MTRPEACEGLFSYGTLQHPDVMEALLGTRRPSRPARLDGYARGQLRGEIYPGIAPAPGASTSGLLHLQLDRKDLELLDRFEGPLYERISIEVLLEEGIRAPAWVYAVHPRHRARLSMDAWSFERFCAEHAYAYVQTCHALRQEHLSEQAKRAATRSGA